MCDGARGGGFRVAAAHACSVARRPKRAPRPSASATRSARVASARESRATSAWCSSSSAFASRRAQLLAASAAQPRRLARSLPSRSAAAAAASWSLATAQPRRVALRPLLGLDEPPEHAAARESQSQRRGRGVERAGRGRADERAVEEHEARGDMRVGRVADPRAGVAEGPEAQLLQAVQEDLPSGLAATELRIIGRSDWSETAELDVRWERGMAPGRRRVQVVVKDSGELYQTWASVRIGALRPVIVTRRSLVKGDRITAADLEFALRPSRSRGRLDISPDALVGELVLRDVTEGASLGPKDVTLPAPIPRGTAVRVVSESGGVRVEVPGRLVTAVRLGGRGRARTQSSRQALPGRLVNPDRFVLEMNR